MGACISYLSKPCSLLRCALCIPPHSVSSRQFTLRRLWVRGSHSDEQEDEQCRRDGRLRRRLRPSPRETTGVSYLPSRPTRPHADALWTPILRTVPSPSNQVSAGRTGCGLMARLPSFVQPTCELRCERGDKASDTTPQDLFDFFFTLEHVASLF